MDDWASDEGEDLSLAIDLPDVEITKPAPALVSAPAPETVAPVDPPINVWKQRQASSDVRKLMRAPAQPQPQPGDNRSTAFRQQPRSAPPTGRAPSGYGAPPGNFGSGGGGGRGKGTVLYVTGLPHRCESREIHDIFAQAGCAEVRLTHHSDTGNVKAAFVELAPGVSPEKALGYDGFNFGGRSIRVKVEGSGRGGGSGRSSYGSSGFGPGGRDGRERNDRGGGGHWGGGSYEPAGGSGGRDRGDRDRVYDRGDRDRDRSQAIDPTIPTGEAPPGRKKLQLKPRTKPMPVFKVDKSLLAEPTRPKTSTMGRGDGAWTRATSNGSRQPPKSAPPAATGTKDDSDKVASKLASLRLGGEKPQPVRKNAFAVLGGEEGVADP